MAIEDRLEKPLGPNAPKVLDLGMAQKLIRSASKYERHPGGELIKGIADQLQYALDEIAGSSSKVVNAQNEAIRFQREAEAANAEVKTMQVMLVKAREDLEKAKAEIVALTPKPEPVPAAPSPVPQKRGRKAKVVQLPVEQKAAQ